MAGIALSEVERTYFGFHSHPDSIRVARVLREFGVWKSVRMSPDELSGAKWWFKPEGKEELIRMLNQDGRLHTVGEVARFFADYKEDIRRVDAAFVEKIDGIEKSVSRGVELPPIIMVGGRNPLAVPSMIEGYHRSLGICVADLRGVGKGRTYEVYLGRKKWL
ncbi:hypothetical protein HYS82_01235 [Candidatus Amesbacteria bacterium]|nr:hypothetical protein [Candidatus Amesbacteria bacterium]MBI2587564.1 hypothetical protein [Candidatus Amesbacteria bacterium]